MALSRKASVGSNKVSVANSKVGSAPYSTKSPAKIFPGPGDKNVDPSNKVLSPRRNSVSEKIANSSSAPSKTEISSAAETRIDPLTSERATEDANTEADKQQEEGSEDSAEEEQKPFWKRKGVRIGFVVGLAGILVLAVAICIWLVVAPTTPKKPATKSTLSARVIDEVFVQTRQNEKEDVYKYVQRTLNRSPDDERFAPVLFKRYNRKVKRIGNRTVSTNGAPNFKPRMIQPNLPHSMKFESYRESHNLGRKSKKRPNVSKPTAHARDRLPSQDGHIPVGKLTPNIYLFITYKEHLNRIVNVFCSKY